MTDTEPFRTLAEFAVLLQSFASEDVHAKKAAAARNAELTKPPGALGRLEEIAQWYAGWRGDAAPFISHPQVAIFAGNHGVSALGVSAFPTEVTAQMVGNFSAGGAAINQLCAAAGATLTVEALSLDQPTADFTTGPAMTEDEVVKALLTGWNSVSRTTDLLVTGEMGIGNTTAAAAISCALFGGDAADWVGRGTGVDDDGLAIKTRVVTTGLARHAAVPDQPLEVLRCLGGRELAAMVGAIARARVWRVPVVLDGFICTAAAAVLAKAVPGGLDHCIAGHRSDENAHARLLEALGLRPLLDLGLRLGEGSGGALAIPIVRAALACHSGMATFAEAGVSGT